MKKSKVLRISLIVLIVLVVLVAAVWLAIDSIAKTGVERGAQYALQTPTELDSMNVSLLRGQVVMNGLTIRNPEGFKSDHLMQSGTFDVEVAPGSLLSDTIEVKHFELDGLDLIIERQLTGTNVSKILDNLKRFGKEDQPDEPAEDEPAEGKQIRVDRIVVRNVAAHFVLTATADKAPPVTVKVPELVIEDIGSGDSGAVTVAELVAKVVPAILAGVLKEAKGVVPDDMLGNLDTQVAETAKAVRGSVDVLIEKGGEGVGKAVEKVGELLGGEKKEE